MPSTIRLPPPSPHQGRTLRRFLHFSPWSWGARPSAAAWRAARGRPLRRRGALWSRRGRGRQVDAARRGGRAGGRGCGRARGRHPGRAGGAVRRARPRARRRHRRAGRSFPPPRRRRLGVALALRDGDAADRFAVGAATLAVLTRRAEDAPARRPARRRPPARPAVGAGPGVRGPPAGRRPGPRAWPPSAPARAGRSPGPACPSWRSPGSTPPGSGRSWPPSGLPATRRGRGRARHRHGRQPPRRHRARPAPRRARPAGPRRPDPVVGQAGRGVRRAGRRARCRRAAVVALPRWPAGRPPSWSTAAVPWALDDGRSAGPRRPPSSTSTATASLPVHPLVGSAVYSSLSARAAAPAPRRRRRGPARRSHRRACPAPRRRRGRSRRGGWLPTLDAGRGGRRGPRRPRGGRGRARARRRHSPRMPVARTGGSSPPGRRPGLAGRTRLGARGAATRRRARPPRAGARRGAPRPLAGSVAARAGSLASRGAACWVRPTHGRGRQDPRGRQPDVRRGGRRSAFNLAGCRPARPRRRGRRACRRVPGGDLPRLLGGRSPDRHRHRGRMFGGGSGSPTWLPSPGCALPAATRRSTPPWTRRRRRRGAVWALIVMLYLRGTGAVRRAVARRSTGAGRRWAVGTLPHLLFHLARADATSDRWVRAAVGLRRGDRAGPRAGPGHRARDVAGRARLARGTHRRGDVRRATPPRPWRSPLGGRNVHRPRCGPRFALGERDLALGGGGRARVAGFTGLDALLARTRFDDLDLCTRGPSWSSAWCVVGRPDDARAVVDDYARRARAKGQSVGAGAGRPGRGAARRDE